MQKRLFRLVSHVLDIEIRDRVHLLPSINPAMRINGSCSGISDANADTNLLQRACWRRSSPALGVKQSAQHHSQCRPSHFRPGLVKG